MTKQPNILVFMTDQQRGDSLTNTDIIMPNLRSLMDKGVHFSNTHCPSPHCCPSRATFFTGQYPTQHGIWNNVCVQNSLSKEINPHSSLFSSLLSQKNYHNYFAGKWHVCYETGPEDHHFEELLVTSNKASKNDPTSAAMMPGWEMYKTLSQQEHTPRQPGQILRYGYPDYVHYGIDENPFNDRGVVESALKKLQQLRSSDDPWLMYIGTLGPHDPYFVPQHFLNMYADYEVELSDIHFDNMLDKPVYNRKVKALFDQLSIEEKKASIKHYMAFCTYEDHLFGLVLDELKRHNRFDDTLILFTSDHGDYNGEHGLWCKGLPAFRGAYHIPAVAYWKNGIVNPGRTVDHLVSLADFAPTILELANTEFSQTIVGSSLTQYLYDLDTTNKKDYLYTQTNGNEVYGIQRAVFNDDWKLVYNALDTDELYNLKQDPNELNNLIEQHDLIGTRKKLYKKMWEFAASTNDQCVNPYILVGLAEFGPAIAFE
ncbi:sulfatase-like hydrolase/transferase [Vibrio sp. 10N.261.51.F12]|uniref:sulfatase-like hydrolase/transferase n=1 Tax=Vibrio sp. 10N.261.51.F12 TaxID=3229679 RepID=UPI00354E6B15